MKNLSYKNHLRSVSMSHQDDRPELQGSCKSEKIMIARILHLSKTTTKLLRKKNSLESAFYSLLFH